MHVYALLLRVGPYRKLDARSIIIQQLKTASPRVRLFSAATSARDVDPMRHNGNYVAVSMFLKINKFI